MVFLVDTEFSEFDDFGGFLSVVTSSESSDAGSELSIITGLHEIVVSTIVQSSDDIVLCGTRSEHDDGCGSSLGSELATDLDTIHVRELDIEDDDVIVRLCSFYISFNSISSECTTDILSCEVASDRLCKCDVVFDEECVHRWIDYRYASVFSKFISSLYNGKVREK